LLLKALLGYRAALVWSSTIDTLSGTFLSKEC